MKNKNSAFTLVELLAIIVILAVISLITIPNMMGVIKDSKESTIKSTAQLLSKAAEDYYSDHISENIDKVDLTDGTLLYKGNIPSIGYAFFDERGNAYLKMYYDGYCVVRDYSGEVKLNKTAISECSIQDVVAITLYSNGGKINVSDGWIVENDYASIILEYASKLDVIPTIERTGYTFLGWYDDAEKSIDLSATIDGNISATAQWEKNKYLVTLDSTGGIVNGDYEKSKVIGYKEPYGSLPTPTKYGYIFKGWFTSGGVEVKEDTVLTNPNDHTLYASWEAITYTLILNSNEGYFLNVGDTWTLNNDEASKKFVLGTKYEGLLVPTKDGYSFKGWYTLEGIVINDNVVVENDLTLYAHWEPSRYVVSFDSTGGTSVESIEVTYDSLYGELPISVKKGYIFNGWATIGGNLITSETKVQITSDSVLYAQWSVNKYLISYDANGGIVLTPNSTITFGDNYGELPEPTKLGHTFVGWYTDKSGGELVTSSTIMNIASNHSLYAHWEVNSYNIDFAGYNFETGTTIYFNPTTGKVCKESEAVSTTGTKDGCMKWYAFLDSVNSTTVNLILDHNTTAYIAWNSTSGMTTPDTVNAQLQTDITNWKDEIKATTRLITAEEISRIAKRKTTWNVNDPSKVYYFHTGITSEYQGVSGSNKYAWLFDNTSNCTMYGCNVGSSTTYGYWTSTLSEKNYAWGIYRTGYFSTYSITSASPLGVRPVVSISKSLLNSVSRTYGEDYGELFEPVRSGYKFNGWYTTGGIKVEDTTEVTLANDHTLYAQWSANTYTITFIYNNGNDDTSKIVASGETYGELPIPTRNGHSFQGWYTSGGVSITNETEVTIASDHTLYAQWAKNITFPVSDGFVVYFNPVTGEKCNSNESISTTGAKDGCMRWYAFLDSSESTTIKLLLDHNTTGYVAWNSTSGMTTPDTVNAQLQSDIINWNDTIKSTARLISASEINQIAPKSSGWVQDNTSSYYYLHTGTTKRYIGNVGSNNYAWLFDNTYDCTYYGCNYDGYAEGYWTSSYAASDYAWIINYEGMLYNYRITNTYYGVRPVIEVSKALFDSYPATYNIVLHLNRGTSSSNEWELKESNDEEFLLKTLFYEESSGSLPIPEREGYTFAGWYTTGGNLVTGEVTANTLSDINLYAQWTANEYIVTFDSLGGTIGESTEWQGSGEKVTKTLAYSSQYGTLPTPTREGYSFTGWYHSEYSHKILVTYDTVRPASDHTVYAQWQKLYTITYNPNGGEVSTTTTQVTTRYETMPVPIREGYVFVGWYTSPSGGTKKTQYMSTESNDETLYAHWDTNYTYGTEVYVDVLTGNSCTNYFIDNSKVGYRGTEGNGTTTSSCLKFHVMNDCSNESCETINLILDHNISSGYATSSCYWDTNNDSVPNKANSLLESRVSGWESNLKNSARLVSATEINKIAPSKNDWLSTNSNTTYYLHTGTASSYSGKIGTNKYGWLFENLYNCTSKGCNGSYVGWGYNGYWTSTEADSTSAWAITSSGNLVTASKTYGYYGVRPVVTVDISVLP